MIKCIVILMFNEIYKVNICNVGCRVRCCNCNVLLNLELVMVVIFFY